MISILAGTMFTCPIAFPIEFRNDVVAVARKGEASIAQVAKNFSRHAATQASPVLVNGRMRQRV